MIELDIPGFGHIKIKYFVMDYNGTLAIDGKLKKDIIPILNKLSERVEIHIVTADTFGKARKELKDIDCKLTVLPEDNQIEKKVEYIRELGKENCVAFGNGRNDSLMLKEAKIGIALIQEEGGAIETILNSNLIFKDIRDALMLFSEEKRLIASLRS